MPCLVPIYTDRIVNNFVTISKPLEIHGLHIALGMPSQTLLVWGNRLLFSIDVLIENLQNHVVNQYSDLVSVCVVDRES